MTDTVSNDRPAVASRPRSRKPATVSASALALHLNCTRTYIGKLEAKGVIRGKVTASRSTNAALPTCDICGVSIGGRRAVRQTQITPRQRPRCYNCG